eukprot:scaffold38203_cov32-Tisochrysis_lutea.AAC.7
MPLAHGERHVLQLTLTHILPGQCSGRLPLIHCAKANAHRTTSRLAVILIAHCARSIESRTMSKLKEQCVR